MLKRMLWTGILNYKLKGKLSLYVIMGGGKEEVSLCSSLPLSLLLNVLQKISCAKAFVGTHMVC